MRHPAADMRQMVGEQAFLFVALAAVAFAPLFVIAAYVARHGGVLTGVNGADFYDQFQYLAWIRDEGVHGLASNLWVTGSTPHDYLQPMYLVSGLLWRLGLGVQLAYLIWKPVALVVLFVGCAAYVRHLVPGGRWARSAALALALFYVTPFSPVSQWLHLLSPKHALDLILNVDDPDSMVNLWGFEHTAIAVGLMPVFLISCERILAARAVERDCAVPMRDCAVPMREGAVPMREGAVPMREGAVPMREGAVPMRDAILGRRGSRRWLAGAAVSGLLVSWLHPWQGVILLIIVAALPVLRRDRRRYLALVVPALATLAPLVYGVILSRTDASWNAFQRASTTTPPGPAWALAASLGPLVVFAALGVRRPVRDRDWMLLLWIVACAAVYLFVPQFPPHALCGITLALSVLAVRGWERTRERLRFPARPAAALAMLAVLACTVPSLVRRFQDVASTVSPTITGGISRAEFRLTADENAALSALAANPRPGGVLAPWLLSLSVPAFTDRSVYAGHTQWEPAGRPAVVGAFYSPGLRDPTGALRRAMVVRTAVRFVIVDCGGPPAIGHALTPLAVSVERFGCVSVYEMRS